MDFYYGTTRTPLSEGKVHLNPVGFLSADPRATRVYLVGNFPRVERAYKARGVPVCKIDPNDREALHGVRVPRIETFPAAPVAPASAYLPTSEKPQDQAAVVLPADWEQMPWADLRRLAASVSDYPIINKEQAFAAIRNEITRRGEV